MLSERMLFRQHGDEWLGEEPFDLEAGRVAAVAQKPRIQFALEKFLHNDGGMRLV